MSLLKAQARLGSRICLLYWSTYNDSMDKIEKACSLCKTVKPLSDFYRDTRAKDLCMSECKRCHIANQLKRQKEDPISFKTQQMLIKARYRARQKGVPFDLDLSHIRALVKNKCPVLGCSLMWATLSGTAGGHSLPNSPTLDRLDPRKGYVKGNVWIISNRANMLKNNATPAELIAIHKTVISELCTRRRCYNDKKPG